MKAFVRRPGAQKVLARIIAAYLRFAYATARWTVEGEAKIAEARKGRGKPTILCLWHSRVPVAPVAWRPRKVGRPINILISQSSDGEFITLTMAALGYGAVRGSRAKEDSVGDKRGSAAFREMVRQLKGGAAMAVTPDGPRGPAEVMGEGVPLLARLTGAEVILAGIAFNPCKRGNSWDRTIFPLPFARASIVWDGPLTASREDDPAALERDWGERLRAVTRRAEEIVA